MCISCAAHYRMLPSPANGAAFSMASLCSLQQGNSLKSCFMFSQMSGTLSARHVLLHSGSPAATLWTGSLPQVIHKNSKFWNILKLDMQTIQNCFQHVLKYCTYARRLFLIISSVTILPKNVFAGGVCAVAYFVTTKKCKFMLDKIVYSSAVHITAAATGRTRKRALTSSPNWQASVQVSHTF